jgi:hypothetical protein
MWRIGGKQMMVYARAELSPERRLNAAKALKARLMDKPTVVAGTAHHDDKTNPSTSSS